MTSYILQRFGSGQSHHSKVPWPAHLESTTCTVPTSFIKLLANNTPPLPSEASSIREYQRFILDSLMLERSKQNTEGQSGTTRIHNLEKRLFICDVILSPFRRLPNDILYEIALHCPQYIMDSEPNSDSIAPTHVPFVLSQVSKGWQEVVFKMSSLWSDIRMESINWDARDIEALKQRSSLFAKLTDKRPLSVDLRQIRAPPIPNMEDVGPSMRRVVYSQDDADKMIHGFHRALSWVWMRWDTHQRPLTKLSLTLNEALPTVIELSSILRTFRDGNSYHKAYPETGRRDQELGLTLLEIKGHGASAKRLPVIHRYRSGTNYTRNLESVGKFIVELLRMFPNLQHFCFDTSIARVADIHRTLLFDSLFLSPYLSPVTMFCNSLTSLQLSPYLSVLDLHALFSSCPSLESASLSLLAYNDGSANIPSHVCVHNALEELSLTLLDDRHMEDFSLSSVCFPSLHKLTAKIDIPPGMDLDTVDAISPEAFRNVFPAIEILEIKNVCTPQGQYLLDYYYASLLQDVPTLEAIVVHLCGVQHIPITLDFFENFAENPARDDYCHVLQGITLEVNSDPTFSSIDDAERDKVISKIYSALGLVPPGADVKSGLVEAELRRSVINTFCYHTTVWYKWATGDDDTPESAFFIDLERKISGLDSLYEVVVG